MENGRKDLGIKVYAELFECNLVPSDVESLRAKMRKSVELGSMTVLSENFVPFVPYGISGHLTLAESHLNISTWPEFRYMDIDMHSCGVRANPDEALAYLISEFKPSDAIVDRRYTGVFDQNQTRKDLYLPSRDSKVKTFTLREYLQFVESLRAGMRV